MFAVKVYQSLRTNRIKFTAFLLPVQDTKQYINMKHPELNNYINQLLIGFDEQITDSLFRYIQEDRQRMNEYLDMVAQIGNLQEVNKQIGRTITRHYNLKGFDTESNPKNTLTLTYSKLKKNIKTKKQ